MSVLDKILVNEEFALKSAKDVLQDKSRDTDLRKELDVDWFYFRGMARLGRERYAAYVVAVENGDEELRKVGEITPEGIESDYF